MAYEAEVNRVLPQHRMIGLCTYPLDSCPADAVKEVFRNHQFAPGQIAGERKMIESPSFKAAKEELGRTAISKIRRRKQLTWIPLR